MSIHEEAGKVVNNMTDALRGNPLCIAAVFLSALFAVLIYLNSKAERSLRHERELAIIRQCLAPARPEINATPQGEAPEPRFGGPR